MFDGFKASLHLVISKKTAFKTAFAIYNLTFEGYTVEYNMSFSYLEM